MTYYKIVDNGIILADNLTWDEATQYIDAIDDVAENTAIIDEMDINDE